MSKFLSRASIEPYRQHLTEPAPEGAGKQRLTVRFLGVTTLLFSDGKTSLMTDGFFTRPGGLLKIALGRKISPDPGLIRRGLRRAGVDHLAAEVENRFCSITLTTLDGKPISEAAELLLVATARSANTGMKWNDERTTLLDWGSAPMVIEPVAGTVVLRDLKPFEKVEVMALDGAGQALDGAVQANTSDGGCRIRVGKPATPWYLIRIDR